MENKIYLKKEILIFFIIFFVLTGIFILFNHLEYLSYTKNYNTKINGIFLSIKEKYPELPNNEIMDIIESTKENKDVLKDYGYDINSESIIRDNKYNFYMFLTIEVLIIMLLEISLTVIYLHFNKKKNNDIKSITKLIDKINHKNYELNIEELTEDELSILKNEIYKTTLTLKENADNSLKDKIDLKKSLEDISHQIRTPLTSIIINIDNLIDNSNIDEHRKDIIMRKIKREALNIKVLVENILKLSRFDVNVVKFNRKDVLIEDLINESVEGILPLGDLKNIKIEKSIKSNEYLYCDYLWEKEAISNILKNATEHAYNNSVITIRYESNDIYSKLQITNNGDSISKKDLKHIFERFYKGDNSKSDSFGIGLALAKKIIEEDNGKIFVSSLNNETKFTIKYFNKK